MSQNISTPRVLSPRALQELLKRNHSNFVSILVGGEVVHRIHRPVAKRFSHVWRSALQDPNVGIVTVTFPSDPPAAPPVAQPGPSSSSTQETAAEIRPPTALAANRISLKFVVQWMEEGGADASGKDAVPYPKKRPGLERLLALAEALEIRELAGRLRHDLGKLPARRCPTCHNAEHPNQECQRCWHCHEIGHRRGNCAQAYQEYLEREERRRKKAEWEKRQQEREERHEAWLKKKEEREERTLQQQIRRGQVAVGDAGKVIYRWR